MIAYSGFMKLKIRYLFMLLSILILSIGLVQPAFVQAAGGISGFHSVTLWLYPEYDDPRLLVMLEGKVAANEVPTQISFLVTNTAEMYSAGSKDAQGKYSGGPPDRIASQIAGWDQISYQLKTDTFRVEYYDNIITGTADKKIAYDFRWLYPMTDLTVIVQQPLKTSNFTVIPAGTPGTEGQFSVNTYNFSNPDINKPLHFDISYSKTNHNLTLTLIVITALVSVAVVVFFIINRLKKKKPAKKVVETRPRIPNKTAAPSNDKFCDQCGRPIDKRFKFCPHCGNDLDSNS
jgi:hypothetical protein